MAIHVKYVQVDIFFIIIDVLDKLKIVKNMSQMEFVINVKIISVLSKLIEVNVLIKKIWKIIIQMIMELATILVVKI